MNRYLKFAMRYARARQFGVSFRGTTHTRLPESMRFGGRRRAIRLPAQPLLVADFIDVVLDDEYGLRQIAGPIGVIVDIGANIGTFTNFARDRFPGARIDAYEPSPETAAYARFNTDDPLTTVYEEGVAGSDGHADMVELGASNIARTEVADDGAITLTSFATVIARAGGHIDLLKVDCEGAEWDFMNDAVLFAHVDRIRMEYHLVDGKTIADVRALAPALGYRLTRLTQNSNFGIAWLDR
jgi:FkbM family methyltransferase